MMVFRVIVLVGLLILLVSSIVPWISINLPILGRSNYNLFDIFSLTFNYISSTGKQVISSLSMFLIILTVISYIVSIMTTAIGVFIKGFCIVGGVLAILSGTSFITGMIIAKSEVRIVRFLEQFLTGLINIEIGSILTIIGGILILIAYTIRER